jgi:hypothetical protein
MATILEENLGNFYKNLSGINWLTIGNSIHVESSCVDLAKKTYLNINIAKLELEEFGQDDLWLDAVDIFNNNPPNKLDIANIDTSFLIGSNECIENNAKLTVKYFDPHNTEVNDISSDYNMRVDSYNIDSGSSSLIENFTGEGYRFKKSIVDANLNDNTVSVDEGGWNSSADIITAIDGDLSLQVANKNLIYPSMDYSSTIPTSLNYSTCTGTRTYYRLFEGIGPYNGGTIIFEGLDNAKDEIIDKSNIEIYLHLPGIAAYHFGGGFENNSIFQDLGIYQNNPGGCLAFTGGSDNSVDFSFNSISSAASNYKCFIKIKIKNINVSINKITFMPTYA